MAKNSTAARVEELVAPAIEALGLRLWDVVYEKEGPEWYLRVLIDRTDGELMDTDTCEKASRAIDPILDEADPIQEGYYLEVGSPGLGRRLTRDEHYEQLKGQKIALHLIRPDETGSREVAGLLLQKQGGEVTLETEAGERVVAVKDASYVKLCDDENLFNN